MNLYNSQNGSENPNSQDKIYSSFYSDNTNISLPPQFNEEVLLEVHFIDVGQGDAILIRLPDQKDIFVDAGSGVMASQEARNDFSDYLMDMSLEELEYLIITHPHSDHVNMADILVNYYDINTIMFHDLYEDTSNTYRNFVDLSFAKENTNIVAIGDEWEFYSVESEQHNYKLDIYAPNRDFSNDTNSLSILCLLEYYNTKILFSGDATHETEQYFMELFDEPVDIDILKVGHHGSSTSSSQEFLDFFNPDYAVICVAENNTYNHPSPFTMNRLFNRGVVTYRTNRHGNIVLYADDEENFGFLCETALPTENNSYQIDEKMIVLDSD
ncbi:MAG: ComEC/Rec2 family competence protein [Bacillota bacterium]